SIGRTVQVAHLACVAAIEPLAKKMQLGVIAHRRDAAGVEAEIASLGFDLSGGHVARLKPRATSDSRRLAHVRSARLQPSDHDFTNCRRTYGRMPPCVNATSSSGVSMRTVASNATAFPSSPTVRTVTVPRGLSPLAMPVSSYRSRPVNPSEAAVAPDGN